VLTNNPLLYYQTQLFIISQKISFCNNNFTERSYDSSWAKFGLRVGLWSADRIESDLGHFRQKHFFLVLRLRLRPARSGDDATNQRPVKRFYPPSSSSPTPILPMASEIEVLEDTTVSTSVAVVAFTAPAAAAEGAGAEVAEDESLKNDVYTAAAYGDLEKLQRLVEGEGRPVNGPDGGGYHALQWAALNNRVAAAQYILEVGLFRPCLRHAISVVDSFLCLLLVDLDWVGIMCIRSSEQWAVC
jgi:hypothetical protein